MSANITRPPHPSPTRAALPGLALAVIASILALTGRPVAADAATPPATDVEPAAFTGPASSANARFIVASYRELLGRPPETAGLDFHLSRIAAGGDRSRGAFTYALLFSTEGSRREVGRAYESLLARSADPAGEAYWTAHLQGHGVLDLRVLVMASDEYRNRAGGTDETWLDSLYRDVLGRSADPGGRRYWLDQIRAGVARPLVVAGIYLSPEALGRRVDTYYQEALGRLPSPAERGGAIAIIVATGERGLRARLWASDERFERFLASAP